MASALFLHPLGIVILGRYSRMGRPDRADEVLMGLSYGELTLSAGSRSCRTKRSRGAVWRAGHRTRGRGLLHTNEGGGEGLD